MVGLKDFFVPQHCLQGEEISSHILWESEKFDELKIIIPKGWEFTDISNIVEEDISVKKNEINIKKTELPGYFAFSMKTSRYNKSKIKKEIIGIFNNDIKQKFTKEIYLFRPDIKILFPQKEITLNISNKGNYGFNNYIKLYNKGEGIAFINILEDEKSDIKLTHLTENQEFLYSMIEYIGKKIPKLKKDFPDFSDLLDRFFEGIKIKTSFEKSNMDKIRRLNYDLKEAFEFNWEFAESFIDIIASAYIANINMITPFSSFLNYLKSMRENNVYLLNSLSVLNIKENGFFKGKITITDMALNEYNSIPINFKIIAKSEGKVPIFSLFKWESGGN